ncbi:MAG: AAA family ATPase, partial [Deltaproteobacteria bacterium]|nr:AAA family ATPase [Deltaproteobacteria bacterium]
MVVMAHTPARPDAPAAPRAEPTRVDLEARLDAGPLPLAEALTIGEAVLGALARLHARGGLHRDVRPARVLVGEAPTLGPPDDLAADAADPARAQYLSPEQAGLLERDVDARSDLYAAGLVLFACLAGRPPFAGTLHAVLQAHLSVDPPDLVALRPEVPRALAALVRRLLAKDPRDRYQTAEAARVDLAAIARAVAAGEPDPTIALGAAEPRATLIEPAIVGRTAELAAIEGALARLEAGEGGLLAITSEAGGGKARLLEEVVTRAARRGLWTAQGRGVERAPERPLALFEGVARRARATACADPAYARHLRGVIGDHLQALRTALPDWAPPEADEAPRPLGPEAFGEARSLAAIVLGLRALGTPERPAVVVLDDGQWADELSLEVVRAWALDPEARASRTLLVIAYRSEGLAPGSPLERLPALALAPLGIGALDALVTSMAGRVSDEVVSLVARVSGGNPFLARTTVEGLVEEGALVAERSGWRVDARALAEAGAPSRATTFLERRLGVVSEAHRRLLAIGATLGRTFDVADVAALGGVALAEARSAIDEARRAHLVWSDGRGARATFTHDRLRAGLLDRLADAERKDLHRRAARHFEAQGGMARALEIAWHLAEAGAPELALPFAVRAGDEARARFAFAVAERHYRTALAGAGGADPALRARLTEALGAVLVVRGAADARAHLELARDAALDDLGRARIDGLLGELASHGDRAEALAPLRRGLLLLGHRVPRSRAGFGLALLAQLALLVLGALAPRRHRPRSGAEHELRPPGQPGFAMPTGDLLAARLHYNLAYVLWFRVGRLATLWALLRALRLARRHPDSPELADVLCGVGVPLAGAPLAAGIGKRWLARGLAIARARGDIWVEGRALDLLVFATSMQGRYPEVVARGREALALLAEAGDAWHLAAVRATVSCALYRLGDLPGAITMARPLAEADTRAAEEAGAACLSTWARATGGRLPPTATAERPRDDELAPRARMARRQAEGVRLLAEGRAAEAARVLADAEALGLRAAGARQEVEAVTACWLATSLRESLAALAPHDAEGRRRTLAALRGAGARARRWTRQFPGELPHALREAGLLAAIRARPRRARALLGRSIAEAERSGERLEAALGHLWLGRVTGRGELVERARAEL